MDWVASIQNALGGFISGINAFASNSPFVNIGLDLLGGILALLLTWQGIRYYLEGTGARQMIASIIALMMSAGLADLLIQDQFGIKDSLVQSINTLGTTFQSGGSAGAASLTTSNVSTASASLNTDVNGKTLSFDMMFQAIGMAFQAVKNIWTDPTTATGDQSTLNGVDMLRMFSFGSLSQLIEITLVRLVCTIFLLIAAVVVTFYFVYSQVLVSISYLLAPIFIPFMVWDRASFIFSGWLNFFITALLYKLIGLLMIVLMSNVMVQNIASLSSPTASGDIFVFLGQTLIVCVYALMFFQIPNIVNSLVSSSSASSNIFGSLKPSSSKKVEK